LRGHKYHGFEVFVRMLQEDGSKAVEGAVTVHGAVCVSTRNIRVHVVDDDLSLKPF
jgi:hypothetical protein